eukprot:TRINITY_DN7389_c0_g1_i1.p4 TRINITY_DN7389_c0_g1~~TRINITY_DN7389_c0_g1_i1.p4  ORF type:complete len:221 (-),score=-55.99 TRINITY_DN7389_c0_g1_i1:2596-3258(-)
MTDLAAPTRELDRIEVEPAEGGGCHSGADRMHAEAVAAGKGEVLDALARDYPKGPHDQPQSMCPAFGSLRVGLRMRRTATILSGSACCVYGLTFTSHFLRRAADRRLRSVQLRDAGYGQAVRGYSRGGPPDRRSGAVRHRHRHQPVRADSERRAAPAAAQGNQRRAHHWHRRAGLWRADPCGGQGRAGGRYARLCAQGSCGWSGPGAAGAHRPPDRDSAG